MATEKKAEGDLGTKEIQAQVEEAQRKGFFGVEADPSVNKAHSLESGPDSPPVAEQGAVEHRPATKEG